MKNRYRKFKRGKFWWFHDSQTGKQKSLKIQSEPQAIELVLTMNKPYHNAGFHIQMAKVHFMVADARGATRTWQDAINEVIASKDGQNQIRWQYNYMTLLSER
jgi:hypothetical protein